MEINHRIQALRAGNYLSAMLRERTLWEIEVTFGTHRRLTAVYGKASTGADSRTKPVSGLAYGKLDYFIASTQAIGRKKINRYGVLEPFRRKWIKTNKLCKIDVFYIYYYAHIYACIYKYVYTHIYIIVSCFPYVQRYPILIFKNALAIVQLLLWSPFL